MSPLHDDCTICQVSIFKLLGVVIDHNLKWNDHIDHIMKSVGRNLHLLQRMSWFLPRNARLAFYFAYFVPHFNYTVA